MTIIKPRGTRDRYGQDFEKYQIVLSAALNTAKIFGFQEVILPIFEHAELFHRQNEASDIVKKELYEFVDRGERKLALRPEATAALLRMVGENKLLSTQPLPLKIFTYGPMFRYERPQSGRQREFYQFDVEIIGGNSHYDVINVISFADQFLSRIKVVNKPVLKINYLGSPKTRKIWIEALQTYFANYLNQLSLLSQDRVKTNPLRILDDKIDGKLDFVKAAPKIDHFLSDDEKLKFNKILMTLNSLKIDYEVDLNLVRGLDYYTGIVFEYIQTDTESQQSTLIAGGEYDGLVSELTQKDYPGIGLAIGIDRCIDLVDDTLLSQLKQEQANRIFTIVLDENLSTDLIPLISTWQQQNIHIVFESQTTKIDKAIKLCERLNYRYLGIVGLTEFNNQALLIKDLQTRKQTEVKFVNILSWWQSSKE
ncbi:histidine--tRNA ligase [[Mycoplasma] testudinis]|uniref:histidine--tRNA ligase n=1 Tax=[Mycoplasma] testudinis TaxID=33924 RepID=UPI00048485E0|nr:histidine--tRNA ligase [[Mycoplasma] testudinis]